MAQNASSKKVANSLVSASCAGVLAVYIAGYVRTESAADKFASQIAERRPAPVATWRAASVAEELRRKDMEDRGKPHASPAPPPPKPKIKPAASVATESAPVSPTKTDAESHIETQMNPLAPAPVAWVPEPEPPAVAPVEEPKSIPVTPAAATWKDGTYTGWGYSRHGNIEASVVIEGGRIASATISQCRTRYSCSVIDRLPPQVAQRQSPDVDYVSGATQSADAFYGAVVSALNKAK
jgi:uncharacterized protein with FMN-binding domain